MVLQFKIIWHTQWVCCYYKTVKPHSCTQIYTTGSYIVTSFEMGLSNSENDVLSLPEYHELQFRHAPTPLYISAKNSSFRCCTDKSCAKKIT